MPAKNAKGRSGGFSADERAAMKARAEELRAEGKKGVKKADGLQAVLDKIAEMAPDDRALAERVHMTMTTVAPEFSPRTWYGMPAYTNADGKIVVAFKNSGKFDGAIGAQRAAGLSGDLALSSAGAGCRRRRSRTSARRVASGRRSPSRPRPSARRWESPTTSSPPPS